MSGESIKFGGKKISNRSFDKNKKLFRIQDIDINKILVSKKVPYGKESIKYYIEYDDDDVIRSLCIKLPQMIGYVKYFRDSKTMHFNADNRLLKTYTKIWEKASNLMNVELDSEPVYGDKFIKTK